MNSLTNILKRNVEMSSNSLWTNKNAVKIALKYSCNFTESNTVKHTSGNSELVIKHTKYQP